MVQVGWQTEEEMIVAILALYPDLDPSGFCFHRQGWDSVAIEAGGRSIFKFPKTAAAQAALQREAALLRLIRPRVSLPVPAMRLHGEDAVFSEHALIPGDHLLTAGYDALGPADRDTLAATLARFYRDLHRIAPADAKAAGVQALPPWMDADGIARRALPLLAPGIRARATVALDLYRALGPDPLGSCLGYFDGHGWNMAFDHKKRRLNGIYDFADAGIGPVHQEFIYASFISFELSERLMAAYEALTRSSLDRRRIWVLTGVHRLWELAEMADDPDHGPTMQAGVEAWAASVTGAP
ncbi:phosphotransferase family protein [Consotaella aegiceratis]|uniref:phosphotransferase family protein n=1 Tax=Consotaella aegiceratis TaxID=3097961 RepID=UPI002F413D4D